MIPLLQRLIDLAIWPVWILVIIALVCAGRAILEITRE